MVYSLPFGTKSSSGADKRPRLDAKSPDFPSWLHTVPTIDDNGFILSECAAIVCYLADKHQWQSFYPSDMQKRAVIHEYMHWHHNSLRHCSLAFFMPEVHPDHCAPADVVEHGKKLAISSIELLDARLADTGSEFIHGSEPTLSDLLCYGELGQLSSEFLDLYDFNSHKRIPAWLERMKLLPEYDEAHTALRKWLPTWSRMRGNTMATRFDASSFTFWNELCQELKERSPLFPMAAEKIVLAKQEGKLDDLRGQNLAITEDVCHFFNELVNRRPSDKAWVNDFAAWWMSDKP